MASTINAFDLLLGQGEVVQKSKKKKSSKPKPKPATAEAAKPAAPTSDQPPVINVPVVSGPRQVEVSAACAKAEETARSCDSGTSRAKAWKQWAEQAESDAVEYVDADGSVKEFKQVLLLSRALETTLESCLKHPLGQGEGEELETLLASFLPERAAGELASVVSRLGALLATDPHAHDTMDAARHAVRSVVAALKAAAADAAGAANGGVAAWVDKLGQVEGELSSTNAALAKLADAGATVGKQHMEAALRVVALHAEKLDLTAAPGRLGGAAAAVADAAARATAELREVVSAQLHAAAACESGGSTQGPSRAQLLAGLKAEEAGLAQQASALAGQMRALEAQLASLRAQAAELEERRGRVAARVKAAQQAGGSSERSAPRVPSSHYQQELAAADALAGLVDPAVALGADAQATLAAVRSANRDALWHYHQSCRQLLNIALGALQEAGGRVAFAKQRKAQAERLAALASATSKKEASTTLSKQAADASKLLQEALEWAQEVAAAAARVRDEGATRFAMRAGMSPPEQERLRSAQQELDELAAAVAARCAQALSGDAHPAAPPQAAPTQARVLDTPTAPPVAASAPGPAAASRPDAQHANGGGAAWSAGGQAGVDGFMQVGGKKTRRGKA